MLEQLQAHWNSCPVSRKWSLRPGKSRQSSRKRELGVRKTEIRPSDRNTRISVHFQSSETQTVVKRFETHFKVHSPRNSSRTVSILGRVNLRKKSSLNHSNIQRYIPKFVRFLMTLLSSSNYHQVNRASGSRTWALGSHKLEVRKSGPQVPDLHVLILTRI